MIKSSSDQYLYSISLKDFFESEVMRFFNGEKNQTVLEIGCGKYSFFEDLSFSFSVLAIDKEINYILETPNSSKVTYFSSTIAHFQHENNSFDLIFDSHAIHCILNEVERKLSFNRIYQLLRPMGLFSSEMMIKKSKSMDRYQFPGRILMEASEIEGELLQLGFKILFFVIVPHLYFEESTGTNVRCDLLRFIVQKV